jgi:hypothetical protein
VVVVEVLIPRMGGYSKWERSDPMTREQARELVADCRTIGYRTRVVGRAKNERKAKR